MNFIFSLLIILAIWCTVAVGIRLVRYLIGPAPIPRDYTPEVPAVPKPMQKPLRQKERLAYRQKREDELRAAYARRRFADAHHREVLEFRAEMAKKGANRG